MSNPIEKVSYPPYIELFARKRVEGWDAWGDEATPEDYGMESAER